MYYYITDQSWNFARQDLDVTTSDVENTQPTAVGSVNSNPTVSNEIDSGERTVELPGDGNEGAIIVVIPPSPASTTTPTTGLFTNVEAILIDARKGLQGDSGEVLINRLKSVDMASQSDIHLVAWATTDHLMAIAR